MSAYIIVSYDITDPEAMAPYVPGVMPLLMKYGAEVLVAGGEVRVLEGESRMVDVVLRFPDMASAQAWYDDPEYAPFRDMRQSASTRARLVLAQAFSPSH